MTRTLLLSIAVLLVLPATSLAAKKKEPKPLVLEPLAAELRASQGELSGDQLKVLKIAGRCLVSDKHWERGQENNIPVNQIYELLASSVVCWQGAEKKGAKLGESFAAVNRWMVARARYVECLRSFIWGIDAKLSGDRAQVCRRMKTAIEQSAQASEAAAALQESYSTEGAQALAGQMLAEAKGMAEMVGGEFRNQKCG